MFSPIGLPPAKAKTFLGLLVGFVLLVSTWFTSPLSQQSPNLAGRWVLGEEHLDGTRSKAIFRLEAGKIGYTGGGSDEHAKFLISKAHLEGNKLEFEKTYLNCGDHLHPIKYSGVIDWQSSDRDNSSFQYTKHAVGVWQFSKRVGFGWRGTPVTCTGRWEAAKLR